MKYCQTKFSPTTGDLKCFQVDRITYILLHAFTLAILWFSINFALCIYLYLCISVFVSFSSWQDRARIMYTHCAVFYYWHFMIQYSLRIVCIFFALWTVTKNCTIRCNLGVENYVHLTPNTTMYTMYIQYIVR